VRGGREEIAKETESLARPSAKARLQGAFSDDWGKSEGEYEGEHSDACIIHDKINDEGGRGTIEDRGAGHLRRPELLTGRKKGESPKGGK